LTDARVLDANGSKIRLGDLWEANDALVAFVRHFGCAGCSEHVTELAYRSVELDALGVRCAVVGSGRPEHVAGFVARHGLEPLHVPVYTDPSLHAFQEADLVRSIWGAAGPRAMWQLVRAWGRGHANGAILGDRYQQGGTLLVRRGGEILLYDRAEHLGDHAPVADAVDVALRIRASEIP
jgi:hypothetical protein